MKLAANQELALALDRVAASAHSMMPMFVSLQPDGSGAPEMLALRDAFYAFPAPADVLFIDATGASEKPDKNSVWSLIRFDLSMPGKNEIRFTSSTRLEELPAIADEIKDHFRIEGSTLESIRELSLMSFGDGQYYAFMAPFDIRTNPEEYGRELGRWVGMSSRLGNLFLSELDFNAKYGLSPDPILSTAELLRLDSKTELLPSCSNLRPCSLQELQEDVAGIQLIPQVTESVREVIRRAKKLYIYGYFEYKFFSISQHYAYAAQEAALHARWSLTLPSPTKLSHLKKNKILEEVSLQKTGHAAIKAYCSTHSWRVQNVLVNGRPFPYTAKLVLEWLRGEGLVTDWQVCQFSKGALPIRNSFSHMERCSTHMPEAEVIRRAVERINILFDPLPIPTSP